MWAWGRARRAAGRGMSTPRTLSQSELLLFALVSAIVTANAYYIHPIIARVAEHFAISAAWVGMVPALNQIALALGIFFLLPLGDRVNNRRLVFFCVAGQCASLILMAFAERFDLFVVGSTLLGFFTIAPYLLPAYVSKHVVASRLGYATALLTTGIIAGILIARAGAGVMGEYLGWRSVYVVAAALMLGVSLLLPMLMADEDRTSGAPVPVREGYGDLLISIPGIIRSNPSILVSGAIQGCNFGIFLAVWMGLGLHLTSPEMGYGVDVVGYLAALSAINLVTTPRMGAWADRVGARRARFILSVAQFGGVASLLVVGHSLWLLFIPITVMNLAGPVIDVTGRMTFLNRGPEIRTRLMTVYIIMMFIGAGAASWLGTAAYDWYGWTGNALLSLGMSSVVLTLSWQSWRTQAKAGA